MIALSDSWNCLNEKEYLLDMAEQQSLKKKCLVDVIYEEIALDLLVKLGDPHRKDRERVATLKQGERGYYSM